MRRLAAHLSVPLLSLGLASCGSEVLINGSSECVAGQEISCACEDGRTGSQTCSSDGSEYSPCVCTGGPGQGGRGGDGGAPPTACDANEDCPTPGPCLVGVCAGGECAAQAAPDGSFCDDGVFCNGGEVCSAGSCLNANTPACVPQNVCEQVVCDEMAAACFSSTIDFCASGDGCCPPGCTEDIDDDCLYWESGVQQNVPESELTGWELCHIDSYQDNSGLGPLLNACDKGKLLMACRQTGSPVFTLLAMADRGDVLFECGASVDCVHQANGVGWYFSSSYSWGFAPGGEPVNRNSCDYNGGGQTLPHLRMCWHTGQSALTTGYRCGDNDLNFEPGWERLVFHAD